MIDLTRANGQVHFGVGIEDTFVVHSSPGHRRLEEYELTQHYQNLDEDFDLIAGSGASFVRYGLPWYRVCPERRSYDWDIADRMIDGLVSRGLQVVLDLVHYGTPTWLSDEFANADYPQVVSEYAAALADRYGDVVYGWTPLNEPQWTARLCGESATWPPALTGHDGYLRILDSICRGIVMTHEAIGAASWRRPTFVDVEASFRYVMAPGVISEEAELLSQRRFLALDLVTGRVDEDHPMAGYIAQYGPAIDLAWYDRHAIKLDVLGLNYYPMWSTIEYSLRDGQVSGIERDDGVVGLEDVIRTYGARYGAPIVLTETSYEGDELARTTWLGEVASAISRIDQESNVTGLVWWPFLDQIKWQYREGIDPLNEYLHRLGLVTLECTSDGSFRRCPNDVYSAYRTLACQRDKACGQTA